MKHLKLSIMIFLLQTAVCGQDSLNCRLLTTTDLVSPYALEVKDNFAFTGAQKFSILNISDIYNPILVYDDVLPNNFISAIDINGDYGYLGGDYEFFILDLSSYESPVVLSHLIMNEVIEDLIVDNNIAYLGTLKKALLVFDVSDPQNPYEIARIDENIDDVWGLDLHDSLLFAASEDTGVKVFDISVPSNPIELATLNMPYGNSASKVKYKDNIVYYASPHLASFDISDINNPQLLDILEGTGGYAIDIEGNYAYCTGLNKLTVVDISNPADLKVAGYYPLPSPGFDVFVKNKIAHVASDGIYFIQFDEPTFVNEANNNLNEFFLSQNYPNPFNPITTINYQIPELSFVTIKFYDVLGSEIITLVNEEKPAGSYEVEFGGTALPSGIYFYRLQAGSPSAGSGQSFVETKKMVLMK